MGLDQDQAQDDSRDEGNGDPASADAGDGVDLAKASLSGDTLDESITAAEVEEDIDPDLDEKYERYVLSIGNHLEVIVEPRRTRSWKEFCKNAPPYSIALDGYVEGLQEPLLIGGRAPKINFNHHEGVHRRATTSSCRQVFDAIQDNLFKTFEPEAGKKLRVYVNDCDHDVCLSIWLLANHETAFGASGNQLLEKLVDLEDRLDRFAGAYPVPLKDPLLGQLSWMFKPYDLKKDRIMNMSGDEMADVIETVGDRISATLEGRGRHEVPATGYKNAKDVFDDFTVENGGWLYVTDEQPLARTKYRTEDRPFISVREQEGDFMRVSIGKFGPFVPVSLEARYEVFNLLDRMKGTEITTKEEEEAGVSANRWSGSGTIGGSPRNTGTQLTLNEQARVNNALDEIETGGNGGLTRARLDQFLEEEAPGLLDENQPKKAEKTEGEDSGKG